jgi:hypothetical protein
VSGEIKKNLVGSEGRRFIAVEATLLEGKSDTVACGPFHIEADCDFDYVDGDSIQDLTFVNPEGIVQTVLPFSLGQLESIEAAQEASARPLNVQIAEKIVDAIFCEW